jgi:YcxB-like protein
MPSPGITIRARPSRWLLVRTRLRLYLRSGPGLQLTLGGLLGPPIVWLIWKLKSDKPWEASNTLVMVAGTVFALGLLARVGLGGLRNPQTVAFLREGADFELSDDGVASRYPSGESRSSWDRCTRALEYPDSIVLRFGGAVHLLPRADIAPGELDALRALLRRKLGKRARLQG